MKVLATITPCQSRRESPSRGMMRIAFLELFLSFIVFFMAEDLCRHVVFAHTGIVPSGFDIRRICKKYWKIITTSPQYGYKILFICNTDTFLMNMNKPSLYLYLHV